MVTTQPNAGNRRNSVVLSAAKNLASIPAQPRFFAGAQNDDLSAIIAGSTVAKNVTRTRRVPEAAAVHLGPLASPRSGAIARPLPGATICRRPLTTNHGQRTT